ncbi:hypothetical protein H5410_044869 [Solanum commersonii]|uniref:Uncharacterized protein n=1 Tax=Solanum commersonii TaxID=4109 RepID=A0A9J5X852_SOLCO|nr:hypothetical protein H5410_044869 [Solanum commersonii]
MLIIWLFGYLDISIGLNLTSSIVYLNDNNNLFQQHSPQFYLVEVNDDLLLVVRFGTIRPNVEMALDTILYTSLCGIQTSPTCINYVESRSVPHKPIGVQNKKNNEFGVVRY